MLENIGKLTTPSGRGASIEINNSDIYLNTQHLYRGINTTAALTISVSNTVDNTASISLYGNNFATPYDTTSKGKLVLRSGIVDGYSQKMFILDSKNSAPLYDGKEIEVIEEIYHKSSSTNDCNWYKKYSNGLVEMSGQLNTPSTIATNSNVSVIVTLPFAMKDISYQPYVQIMSFGSYWTWLKCAIQNITTTSFTVMVYNDGSGTADPSTWGWRLTGYYK